MRLFYLLVMALLGGGLTSAAFAAPIAATDSKVSGNTASDNIDTDIAISRQFISGPFGQVHVRIAKPVKPSVKPPLVLFHPTPYSSDYFTKFIKEMATDRVVIAIDTPGYGDSDRPAELQSIGGYAESAAAVLGELGYGQNSDAKHRPGKDPISGLVDVLGYHTGCLIAAELAASRPDIVRRLVLPGLPFFTGDKRKRAYDENVKPDPVTADGSHLIPKWKFSTGAVSAGLALERGQEHFNDSMQCYPHCWEAYHAVFTYDAESRFAKVVQPVLLVTTDGSLKAETEAAMRHFPDAKLAHIDGITLGGFDLAPDKFADQTRTFLDE